MTSAAQAMNDDSSLLQGGRALWLVVIAASLLALAIQLPAYLHQDVAWLTWTADRVLRGEVYGRDLLDIAPPLNFLIYLPAALAGRIIGFDLAIKLWTVTVFVLSAAVLWRTAEKSVRLPVLVALGLFFALAFPREFGQREQLALLLCAPYVAGNTERRGLAILSGVMAGIGFALKPYFLVPLLLVFATRRRIRAEEWSIAATGLCYAIILAVFFRPWFLDYVPSVSDSYWVYKNKTAIAILASAALVPLSLAFLQWVSAPQRGVAGYAMASAGFLVAVLLHRKGFPYHFIPCFGFLALYLAARLANERRLARLAAIAFLALEAARLSLYSLPWIFDWEGRRTTIPALVAEIDKAQSFTILSNYNYPAFPTAIYASAPFVGLSPTNNYISVVANAETGQVPGDTRAAAEHALAQALRELGRKPDLVIVNTNWMFFGGLDKPFDGLAWFNRDPRFREEWTHYRPAGKIGIFELYRRS